MLINTQIGSRYWQQLLPLRRTPDYDTCALAHGARVIWHLRDIAVNILGKKGNGDPVFTSPDVVRAWPAVPACRTALDSCLPSWRR